MNKALQLFLLSLMMCFSSVLATEPENATIDLGKVLKIQNQKYIMTSLKKTREIFGASILRIENECCEKNFPKKSRLEEIKKTLQDCLDTKCEKNMIPLFNPKNPPKKLIAFRLNEEVNDLIFDNQKFKYQKLTKKYNVDNLSNENSVVVLKKNIEELSEKNNKLKITVDKMLKNYQTKISELEKENIKLKKNFEQAYEMLPNFKQKKINK